MVQVFNRYAYADKGLSEQGQFRDQDSMSWKSFLFRACRSRHKGVLLHGVVPYSWVSSATSDHPPKRQTLFKLDYITTENRSWARNCPMVALYIDAAKELWCGQRSCGVMCEFYCIPSLRRR